MTRSFTFLVNPASGGGAAPGAVVPVARLLREAGATVDVTYSPGLDAMHDLVAAAVDRGDVVVSVGGDGMLSSHAGLVSARGGTLGILPAGRGNDFARMLGLPDSAEGQARLLLQGPARPVDLLAVSGLGRERRLVAGSVYAGVDARAAQIVDRATWLPRSLPKVYDGGHVALPEVTLLAGKRVEVRGTGRAPIPVGADGEPLGQLPVFDASEPAVVEVVPGAISVLC